jgi:hypothetical protein
MPRKSPNGSVQRFTGPLRLPAAALPRRDTNAMANAVFPARLCAIALLCLYEGTTLFLWFLATALFPSMTTKILLSPSNVSLLTNMVQAGFVAVP